jgi:hypothetical protein
MIYAPFGSELKVIGHDGIICHVRTERIADGVKREYLLSELRADGGIVEIVDACKAVKPLSGSRMADERRSDVSS